MTIGNASSAWEVCGLSRGPEILRRSIDQGRHWQTLRNPLGNLFSLHASSAQTAWAQTTRGAVCRTVDGGRSWSTVWTVGNSQPSGLSGHMPLLIVQSATMATVVVSLTHGHVEHHAAYTNLALYRTNDGGATWQPTVIRLPAG